MSSDAAAGAGSESLGLQNAREARFTRSFGKRPHECVSKRAFGLFLEPGYVARSPAVSIVPAAHGCQGPPGLMNSGGFSAATQANGIPEELSAV